MALATWATGFLLGGATAWLLTSIAANGTISRLRGKLSSLTTDEEEIREDCDITNVPSLIDEPSATNVIYLRLTDASVAAWINTFIQPPNSSPRADDDEPQTVPATDSDREPTPPAPVSTSELENMFGEVVNETRSRAHQQAAALCISAAPATPARAGYATLGELEEKGKESTKHVPGMLKRSEELEVINGFRGILNKKVKDMPEELTKAGYSLRVMYVGTEDVRKKEWVYDAKCLGIRVRKPDMLIGSLEKTSVEELYIAEIVDVGGVDVRNRGMVRL